MLFFSLAGSRETQQISQSAWSAVTPHHHTATTDRYSRTDRYQNPDSQRSLRQPQDQPQNPRDRYATAAGTPENERSLIQVRHNLVFRTVNTLLFYQIEPQAPSKWLSKWIKVDKWDYFKNSSQEFKNSFCFRFL